MTEENEQLAAFRRVHDALNAHEIEYWLFGGWAVDFYAGAVTREHDDVDIAVWLTDHDRIAELLAADGWRHAPEPDEDGGTGYERDRVRLELTLLVRDDEGHVCVPLRSGLVRWSDEAFGNRVEELQGVRARVIELDALKRGKARFRDDAADAAKDRADTAILSRLGD